MAVTESAISYVPQLTSEWRDDHFYVAVCYMLLMVRTGFPRAGSGLAWRLLYQLVMTLAIINFVNAALTDASDLLWQFGYDAMWIILGLMTDMFLNN
ncbi:MAG: hypothetical protein Tsb0020_07920 [Haliangiales bacterium]